MSVKLYNQLRQVGKHLSGEMPRLYGFEKSIPEISRLFGIWQGRQIILEDEEEMNFIIDFYLHEYIVNKQTMLERYRADHPDLEPLEILYLDSARASYTSLFKVTQVNPAQSSLTVIDLLNDSDQSLEVLNINLSKTATPGYVIFSRLLPYEHFNAFSGMFAVFTPEVDRSLLKRYKVMKKRVKSDRESVQRFVACFKLKRILGITAVTV
jgi:hypothetical protein